jgi:membrane associated rhomboid family serine protease
MGIYDREYYRRDGPSFLEAFHRYGVVCKWLIIANVVVYILQFATREQLFVSPVTEALVLNVPKVLDGQVWRLVTYAFLHDPTSIWHILFNMVALWFFGTQLETIYGWKEFLAFYLFGALFGGVAFTLANLAELNGPFCLGASAAVMAVMVVCACLFPQQKILIFWVVPVPIWIAVALYVVMDVTGLLGGMPGARTAFSGHLGGAAFGFAYWYWEWRILNLLPDLSGWRRERSRANLRIYREDGAEVPQAVPAGGFPADEHLEAKMDALLEKISRFGQNSLTDSEREFMKKAAERARARAESRKKAPDRE